MRIPPISLALLALLMFPACAPRNDASAHPLSRILRVSQRNGPDDIDPATAPMADDYFIIRALSEGLVMPAIHGGFPFPAAADHWEESPDGLVWTFHLRPEALWSNGDPVSAEDFVASYRRVLTPATAAPHANLLFVVKNARAYATGQITDFSQVGFAATPTGALVVTLEHPEPMFLDYVGSSPWIPVNPRVVSRWGRQWTQPEHFVGNGPYVLTLWLPDQRIVVKKNLQYHDARAIQIDEIQFIRYDDGNSEERAYRAGEVDVTMALPNTKLEAYARERPQELHHSALAETRYLSFNTLRPPLDDARVRQALSLAIDRERLTDDVLRGGQQPAYRMIPPELRAADDTASHCAPPDGAVGATGEAARSEGQRLLVAAGFPGGHHFPKFELAGWSGSPVLEAIQQMWKKNLGIEVVIANRDARTHMDALRSGRYDIGFMALIPQLADPLPVLHDFTTGAPDNFPHWGDPYFDGLVAAAASTGDLAHRAELLRAAEARIVGLCPVVPLYFNARNWAMRPFVRGWQEDELWNRYYPSLWLDFTAAHG